MKSLNLLCSFFLFFCLFMDTMGVNENTKLVKKADNKSRLKTISKKSQFQDKQAINGSSNYKVKRLIQYNTGGKEFYIALHYIEKKA